MLWITGAKGLLGSALVKQCDLLSKEYIATGREIDISDKEQVRSVFYKYPQIAHVVNCAAFSAVDAAETDRELAWKINAIGPENLALVSREAGAKLVHISTDYIFSGDVRRPLKEEDVTNPCNYYGKTKLEGEKKALEHSSLVIRTSWIFGNSGKNFVAKLLQMLKTEKEIRLTCDQWGKVTYSVDLAKGILSMLGQSGLYSYANCGVVSRYEFALGLKEEAIRLGCEIKTESIIPVPSSSFPSLCKRPVYSALDTAKIERFLKIRHWKDTLKEFLCEQFPACL